MRLIDADKIPYVDLSDGKKACIVAFAEKINQMPTIEPEPHWIPCEERLPETEEQVLIYAWNVHYVLAKYKEIRTCDGVYKMAWVTEDAYNIPREIKHEVICWMPLPEPYNEK